MFLAQGVLHDDDTLTMLINYCNSEVIESAHDIL
jgi:hypothetical protein